MTRLRFASGVLLVSTVLLSLQACGSESPTLHATVGGGSGGNYVPASGACPIEGVARECHASLGTTAGVSSCFIGRQECLRGAWTECGGREITLTSTDLSVSGGPAPSSSPINPMAIATSDAGQCTQDPCNPYCSAFNEDGGLTAEAGVPVSYNLPGGDIFGGSPGGFAGKSNCGGSSKGCNDVAPGAPYPRKCNGENHYSIWDACLADTHCDITRNGGQGDCIADWDTSATADPRWNEATQTWTNAVCPGVDVTVTAACEVNGVAGFNVCNRGNSPLVATSVGIYLDTGNGGFGSSTFVGGTCPNLSPSCSPAVPGGTLAPGRCFRVTNATCSAWTGGGNPVAYVNPQAAIPECGGTATAAAATAPGCNNNWADVKHKGIVCDTSSAFIDTSRTFTYSARCSPGDTIRWKYLTYQATVPCSPGSCNGANAAKIEFYGTLSGAPTGSGPAVVAESIISDATTTQTVNCTFGTDAGGQPKCPVDLAAWANSLATKGANYQTIDLRIRLIPTPDDTESPTLANWALSYDCIPTE